ncbi:uncharacterized protein EDB93DRAFT_1239874 [Suillus bovinus]|uniref:uncharacterized protein n=1 Tax=Suillus bovinus TaxID=48563 RepID=UPI001B8788B0|nr:uncharacterized protein EDB93DRAFT_1239874 [Suillus bovinus]KAG2153086.1 hypothetical protein EDB93DRAFT_1239874 [Suillus bovinus]
MDIVEYLDQVEVKSRLKLTKTISLATAQHWMKHVGYRWSKTPTGQFIDGHKRVDVVQYHQAVFLPIWCPVHPELKGTRKVAIWNHDESTYYANNRRKIRWVHKSETAIPYAKGEGLLLMVADIVSPDYGWLRSPDGTESVQVLFKVGKAREGYFTCEDILKQASNAMDILEQHYPDEDHVIVFDNAMTHLKRVDDALSAWHMPKFSPKDGDKWDGTDWGNERWCTVKKKVPMGDGKFADGLPQSLYYLEGHKHAGVFKGMGMILEDTWLSCNFLEQCWGYSKWIYHKLPTSSKEIDLEQNVVESLDSVPLLAIRWFSTRSLRFMDAYRQGLNGKQAAWALKKYHGHRTLPETIM